MTSKQLEREAEARIVRLHRWEERMTLDHACDLYRSVLYYSYAMLIPDPTLSERLFFWIRGRFEEDAT